MPDLSFALGGDISGFERAMSTALTVATTRSKALESLFKGAATRIDAQLGASVGSAEMLSRVIGGLKVAAGVFLAFEALKYVIDSVREGAADAQKELAGLVKIGNQARDLGIGSTFLQGFTGQASKLGMEASQLEAMLATARDASTTHIGEDGAAPTSTIDDRIEQNQRAGNLPAGSKAAFDAADTQEQRIRVVLGLMDELQAKGATLAALDIGKTMFGEDFERAARTGVDIIGAMKTALDGVVATSEGRVRSEEEIANAQRISAEYAEQDTRLAAAWAGYEESISTFKQSEAELMVELRGLYVDVVEAASKLVGWLAKGLDYISGMDAAAGHLNATIANFLGAGAIHDALFGPAKPEDAPASDAPRPLTIHPKRDTSRSLPSLAPVRQPKEHQATEQKDEVDNLITSLAKSAAAEEGEAAALGKSNVEKQRSIDLSKAEEAAKERGTALTDAERAKIIALADEYSTAKKKIDDFNTAREELIKNIDDVRSGAKDVLGTFVSDIEAGKSAVETLVDALKSLATKLQSHLEDSAIDALFGKSGKTDGGLINLASFFGGGGSAVAGGIGHMAIGGIVGGPGGGTADKVPAMLSAGEGVIPADVVRQNPQLVHALIARKYADGGFVGSVNIPAAQRSAGGSSSSYVHAPTYNLPPSPAGVTPEQMVQTISAYDAKSRRNMLASFDRVQTRFGRT